jgi:hypothetical protein
MIPSGHGRGVRMPNAGPEWVVLTGARVTVTAHLPANRGWVSGEFPGNGAQGVPGAEQGGD